MGNSPAFQYYPADLLTDTEVMFWDMEQLGCYWQMITFLWLNDGKFEYNIEKLCKLFRVNHKKTAEKLWKSIEKKFKIENGIVTHKRVLEEMEKQADTRLKRQTAGKEGAKKRWESDSKTNILPMAKNSSPTPTPPSLIGIEKKSLEDVELGLEKKIKVQALRFTDELALKFHSISQDEATTFARISDHLSEGIRSGLLLGIFDSALGWADEAISAGVGNPKGLFVEKVKEETGYKGRGMVLRKQ